LQLRIWKYPEGNMTYNFTADTGGILSARFVPDIYERVISGSGAGHVRIKFI
jgi:hypothetical protein